MENKNFLGKKRNFTEDINKDVSNFNLNNNIINEDSFNSTPKTNQDSIGNEELINDNKLYNEGITLDVHTHWVNKVLVLQKQPKHNLMSSSADGKILVYNGYPYFNPILIMSLFGESGVTHLTELKNGSIIACSFGALKQIILNYNNLNNNFTYDIINYFVICTTYISKCIELNNNDLLFISQQNSIIILEKIKNNNEIKGNKINDTFIMKAPIKLLNYEICINILQLKDDLYISGSITDTKYNILVKNSKKVNANYVNFYNEKFEKIYKFKNMFLTKSQENIVKIDNRFVAIGIEMCLNEVNWNNNKGIAIINYNNFQLITFYEVENQISSILSYGKYLFIGDNKGYVSKYQFINNEMLLQKSKRVHFYNINSISCSNIYEKDLNQNTLLIYTGSNDNKIKITSYFKD